MSDMRDDREQKRVVVDHREERRHRRENRGLTTHHHQQREEEDDDKKSSTLAILRAFERQSNANAGRFFSFLAGQDGTTTMTTTEREKRKKKWWATFFDGYFGRLWTISLAIAIVSFPSVPLLTGPKSGSSWSSFGNVCAAASGVAAVSRVDCWLRVKCVQGYGMSFAAIVDGLTVVMTPVLPIVREFVLYEQSIGKREDGALEYGVKAFTVGFAEFLFLMRLCIAGAQFLSARWEGNNARYGYNSSEKSNSSGAGVFRRLEQAGAANIALLVATTVTLGPICSGGENSITIIRNYAYYEGANASEIDQTRALRRLMEAGLALVASALFNALFISMRMHLLGKPLEKIIEILERHARSILTDLDNQIDENGYNSNNEVRLHEGIAAYSLDISVLAYVLEKMSNIVDSSMQLRKRSSLCSSSHNGDSPSTTENPDSSDYRRSLCFRGFGSRRFHQSVVEKLRRELGD